MPAPRWRPEPSEDDYASARRYLALILSASRADEAVTLLRAAEVATWPAEAILRAARLPALRRGRSAEVADVLREIEGGGELSPLLLVQDGRGRLEIADGYHRACAALQARDRAEVPARLALLPDMTAQAVTARFLRPPSRRD